MGSSNREEQERVRNLLLDTVTLLCKNGLSFKKQLKVQGLLGITMDENDVFIVHINEQVGEISVEHHKKDSDKKNADIPDDCSENSIESWRSKDSTPSKAHTDKISHRKRTSTSSPIFKGPPEKVKIKTEKQDESACDLIFVGEEDDKSRIPKLPMMQGNAGYGAVPPMGAGPPGTFNQFSSNIQGNVQPGPFITGIVPNPQHSQDNTDKVRWSQSPVGQSIHNGSRYLNPQAHRPFMPRQPKVKAFPCTYPGCGCSFVHKRTMLRHQNEKHGRTPRRKFPPYVQNPDLSNVMENTDALNTSSGVDETTENEPSIVQDAPDYGLREKDTDANGQASVNIQVDIHASGAEHMTDSEEIFDVLNVFQTNDEFSEDIREQEMFQGNNDFGDDSKNISAVNSDFIQNANTYGSEAENS